MVVSVDTDKINVLSCEIATLFISSIAKSGQKNKPNYIPTSMDISKVMQLLFFPDAKHFDTLVLCSWDKIVIISREVDWVDRAYKQNYDEWKSQK